MSGIVGMVNLDGAPVDRGLLARMTAYLAFRGPDRQAMEVAGSAGFGHTLLRITGESEREAQPLTLDGQRWIVADARVDARTDLVAELRRQGDARATLDATDAELILRAYCLWGEECVAHLTGDFTFVVWDEARQRLFGARDQLGVKPFFYARLGATIVVSNTLDCIRLHPAVSRRLNDLAIADFLLFGTVAETDITAFRQIDRLPPAHSITWSTDLTRRRRYWSLPMDEPVYFKRAEEYSERFTELLRASLSDRLRTRRVGVLMSGGIDSTTLAAGAASLLRECRADFHLQAITSVYDRLIPDAERQYAGLVADYLKIPIRYDVRDDEPSIADWERVSARTPEPVANPPAFAAGVEFLSRAAADARVFLYGEGPDNALRYEWRPYLSHLLVRRQVTALGRALWSDLSIHRRVPLWSSLRQLATGARRNRLREMFPRWLNEEFAARYACLDRWQDYQRRWSSRHPIRPLGHGGFSEGAWQSLFEGCDVDGALSHAEFRHPFFDLRLLRYMLAVPAMPWCRNKLLIRRAMRTALPAAVLRRPKTSLRQNPDFQRVLACGFPRLAPTPELVQYVNPAAVPSMPQSPPELLSAMRPLGLNHWLQNLANN
jgi:asparagine synthase (glutamine-hydrolysing)